MMQAILNSELERGRIMIVNGVYRIREEGWPEPDLLEAVRELALAG
jgi:hypothetical protein